MPLCRILLPQEIAHMPSLSIAANYVSTRIKQSVLLLLLLLPSATIFLPAMKGSLGPSPPTLRGLREWYSYATDTDHGKVIKQEAETGSGVEDERCQQLDVGVTHHLTSCLCQTLSTRMYHQLALPSPPTRNSYATDAHHFCTIAYSAQRNVVNL